MIRSLQIEVPPSMKGDPYARRMIVETESGEKRIIDNSPVGHAMLIRLLLHDVDPSRLPYRLLLDETVVVQSPIPDKIEKVESVVAVPTPSTVQGSYTKREKPKKATGLPSA